MKVRQCGALMWLVAKETIDLCFSPFHAHEVGCVCLSSLALSVCVLAAILFAFQFHFQTLPSLSPDHTGFFVFLNERSLMEMWG